MTALTNGRGGIRTHGAESIRTQAFQAEVPKGASSDPARVATAYGAGWRASTGEESPKTHAETYTERTQCTSARTPRVRPIILSGPSVRATLDGRKTQTRRVAMHAIRGVQLARLAADPAPDVAACPYGQPGDRLWVRETFRVYEGMQSVDWMGWEWDLLEGPLPKSRDHGMGYSLSVEYRADDPDEPEREPWRPSIFMPRWASRLTLELTAIRVELLQDISAEDALAEGIERDDDEANAGQYWREATGARYADRWDELNRERGFGWDLNPWVWALEFRRVQP